MVDEANKPIKPMYKELQYLADKYNNLLKLYNDKDSENNHLKNEINELKRPRFLMPDDLDEAINEALKRKYIMIKAGVSDYTDKEMLEFFTGFISRTAGFTIVHRNLQ